jgi:Cu(I)/Ag(I) efflux system membrane fusion protein
MNRKTVFFALLTALALFTGGLFMGMRVASREGVPAATSERQVLFYRNPMNPNITSPTPAKDEMGMDYIPVYEGEQTGDGAEGATVSIAPEVANNLGVRTEAATRGELARRIETVG